MLKNHIWVLLLLGTLGLALSACGGSVGNSGMGDLLPPRVSAALDRDNSIAADSVELALSPNPEGYVLEARGMAGTKALYAAVSYEPQRQHFTGSERASGLADDRLLLVVDRPERGVVEVGMVLANFTERSGLDGDAALCNLRFASGAASGIKHALEAPGGPYNHILTLTGELNADDQPVLNWKERHAGDGDNNGLVTINDFTQIGQQFGKKPDPVAAADDQARDADYNNDGEVAVTDITVIGQQLDVRLSGYAILTGPSADSLTELTRLDRTTMFPTTPVTADGELFWTWTGTDPLAEDTTFWVQPYDGDGVLGEYPSDTGVFLEAPNPTFTVNEIYGINVPPEVPTDGDGNYVVLLSEWSVDDVLGNAEPFAFETLQLTGEVGIVEDTENTYQDSEHLLWYISDGGGLAFVGNNECAEPRDTKGLLSFVNRGMIEVTAQVQGDFNKTASATFVLLSIQDLALAANTTSPSAGSEVQFTATGTFDWDGIDNGNEVVEDLTSWCNWNAIADPGDAPFSINTLAGSLATEGGASGAEIIVRCEYPRTENVTLYDEQRRLSNSVTLSVN